MNKFDLIIIGGGPGGYVAAIYAAQQGLQTALVEKKDLGGVCLNWGCVPTKALVQNAEILRMVKEADKFGIDLNTKGIKADYSVAQKRSRAASKKLTMGVGSLMKKNGVTVIRGEGILISGTRVKVMPEGKILETKNVIIATGAHAFKIPAFDYSNPNIMTSREALELSEVNPGDQFVVVGAGAIGMEFASIWASYGADVTIVEMLPRVLPAEDFDVSKEIQKAFKNRGIKIKTDSKVSSVTTEGKVLKLLLEKNGKSEAIIASKILISAGVRPNVQGLGLETAKVKLTERGFVQVDEKFQTTCLGVYAIGDITGKLALAHVASAQALAAVHAILNKPVKQFNYSNMPRCTYTYPEVASVGLTEEQARDAGYEVKIGTFPLRANAKSVAMNEMTGFVKMIADKKYNEILGIHLVGAHVTELISAATAYIDLEFTADDIAQVVHPHPSVSEAIMEAAHAVVSHAIHI
jgi:dihydrolipoamide dehydrogenase